MSFGFIKANGILINPVLNGSASGTAVGSANNLATLDASGLLTLSQRFIDALSTPTGTRVGLNSSLGTGSYNNIFGVGGFHNISTGSRNTGMGHQVLGSITTANDNSGFGYQALKANTSSEMTAFGSLALVNNTTSTKNTAMGFQAMKYTTTAIGSNTGMGHSVMMYNTTGSFNVGMGVDALRSSNGSSSVAIGYYSLRLNTNSNQNVAVGENSMGAGISGVNNTAAGYRSLQNTTTDEQVAFGSMALQLSTSGVRSSAVGYQALRNQSSGSDNSVMGHQAAVSLTTGSNNVVMGSGALLSANASSNNIAIGTNTLASVILFGNHVAIGTDTLTLNTSILPNVAVGHQAMVSNTNGGANTALGHKSLYSNVTGASNTGVGYLSLYSNLGSGNSAFGREALTANTSSGNSAFGYQALKSNTSYNGLSAFGYNCLTSANGSTDSTAMGTRALISCTTGSYNTSMGTHSMFQLTTGQNNAGFGNQTLSSNNGSRNTAVGSLAMDFSSGSNDCIGVGFLALSLSSASGLTAVGSYALSANTNGIESTALGYQALRSDNGSKNTGVGYLVLNVNTSGTANTAMGSRSMLSSLTSIGNVAMGYSTLSSLTGGTGNVALGYNSLKLVVNQSGNIGIGYSANSGVFTTDDTISVGRYTIATGDRSIAIGGDGTAANAANALGTRGIAIGNRSFSNAVNAIAIGPYASVITANCVQIGQATNSTTSAKLKFRSQIIGDESWISAGTYTAAIDGGGNIIKTNVPVGGGGGGTVTNASNIGTSGVGLFKSLVGTVLQFKNVNNASNKVSVVDNVGLNTVDVDVVEANINHNNLFNYVANQHIDHSSVVLTAGTGLSGGGNITASRTFNLDASNLTLKATPATNDLLVIYDSTATSTKNITISSLQTLIGDTASNVGVSGVGVFKQKVGANLQFKNINPLSTRLSTVDNPGNSTIDMDVVETNINHNNLLNYVANQHVDHSTVSINTNANSGLAGGGNITATRNLSLDVNNLVNKAAPALADLIPIYDTAGTANKNITINALAALIGGGGGGTITGATNVGLFGVGVFKTLSGSTLQFKNINNVSNRLSVVDNVGTSDIDIDVVETNINHNNLLNYVANQHVDHSTVSITAGTGLSGGGDITATRTLNLDINGLPVISTPSATDYLPVYDIGSATTRKVTIADITGSSGSTFEYISGTAGSVHSPANNISTTFVTTTTAGSDMTGTLANGTIDGFVKRIVMISAQAKFALTITSGFAANGAALSKLTFDSTGVSAQLIWSSTANAWFIVGTGALVN